MMENSAGCTYHVTRKGEMHYADSMNYGDGEGTQDTNFFFTESMASDGFSEPPRCADPIFIFLPNFGSGSPPGSGSQSR